jgi:hypothetical protein
MEERRVWYECATDLFINPAKTEVIILDPKGVKFINIRIDEVPIFTQGALLMLKAALKDLAEVYEEELDDSTIPEDRKNKIKEKAAKIPSLINAINCLYEMLENFEKLEE